MRSYFFFQQDLKPGDYVLIEFGHNDAGKTNDQDRARGSFPPIEDQPVEIENLKTGDYVIMKFGHNDSPSGWSNDEAKTSIIPGR